VVMVVLLSNALTGQVVMLYLPKSIAPLGLSTVLADVRPLWRELGQWA
jgi:hypothetical protein